MKNKLFTIFISIFLISCSDDYSPKPLGYHRIELEEKSYDTYKNNCAYTFSIANNAIISEGKEHCWLNISYPRYNAVIHLTYKDVDSNLAQLLEESHKLAYDHSIKSDGISEKSYINQEIGSYGILYDIQGNSASNIQFFITDSSSHFLRGSLYFNSIPNADSLAPVKNYIQEDIQVLMESLRWS